ncbi:hypothetical protein [Streptomyces sp. NPDC002851]
MAALNREDCLDFALEPGPESAIVSKFTAHDLHSDATPLRVLGKVDHSHAACAESLQQHISVEGLGISVGEGRT